MDAAEFNAAVIDEFRASGGTVGGSLADTPLLLLGTTGATTGVPRTTPLAYRREGDRLYVIASHGGAPAHPAWYRNLRAHPVVSVEVGTERFDANATVLEGLDRDRVFAAIVEDSPAAGSYQARTARTIPVVALDRRPLLELQQRDRVRHEEDREDDGPAVQVALDERAAASGPPAGADAEGAGQPGVLPRVQEHQEDQDDGDEDLEDGEDRCTSRRSGLATRARRAGAGSRSPRRAARGRARASPASESLPGAVVELGVADLAVLGLLGGLERRRARRLAALAPPPAPRRSGAATTTHDATTSSDDERPSARTVHRARLARGAYARAELARHARRVAGARRGARARGAAPASSAISAAARTRSGRRARSSVDQRRDDDPERRRRRVLRRRCA